MARIFALAVLLALVATAAAAEGNAVGGNPGAVDPALFEHLHGIADCVPVSKPYKLVSRETHPQDTVIRFDNGVQLGGPHFHVMAGPCSVENREQVLETARAVKEAGWV